MSVIPPKRKTRGEADKASISFNWNGEEVELLLEVVLHLKSDKTGQSLDWESIKTKYVDIRDIFVERYPKNSTDESYLHQDVVKHFSKERIIAKVNAPRNKYKIVWALDVEADGVRSLLNFTICVPTSGEGLHQFQVELILAHQQNHRNSQAIQVWLMMALSPGQIKIKKVS